MVWRTLKPSLRLASCWRVEVVNGGAGLRVAGLVSMPATANWAGTTSSRNFLRLGFGFEAGGQLGLQSVVAGGEFGRNLEAGFGLKFSISRSRSTIRRTATLCTRPALRPAWIFFQSTGDNS
jgi:hypothetical protein